MHLRLHLQLHVHFDTETFKVQASNSTSVWRVC